MSLLVIAAIAAAAAVVGAAGAIAASRARKRAPSAHPVAALPEHGLPLQVGDVVLRGSRELWLTGALVVYEGADCRGAVFLASESAKHPAEAVVALPGTESRIAWVECADQELPESIVPDTLEGRGETLARRARIPVRVEAQGAAPQGLEATGTWMRYEAPSGAVAFVLVAGARLLWRGAWLAQGEWTRLAAGSATLREL
jgi:hypothetical protein